MADPFLDTDVIIRLLTGDDLEKQAAAAALFTRIEAGAVAVSAPDTAIADAVFVLASPRLYRLPRAQVTALLTPLVRLPNFHVKNRRVVLAALTFYGGTAGLDFGDAMILASMRQSKADRIYSYDADFDGVSDIKRMQPTAGG